jgi:16S rRNA (adenine1518-N6/adenine1519-N6)-dimethyltransferase
MVESLTPNLPPNARVIHADFLDLDLRALAEGAGGPLRVAGNLPYNVSSPILFKLLEFQRGDGRDVLVDATLMLQREVAERMTAQAGTGEYGVLSIFVQLQADVRRVLALPPGAFRPAPKVHSAVVRLAFRPAPVDVGDFRRFETMVRTMFTQRRKTLNNALRPFAEASATDPATLLSRAGIDPRRRPETLQLSELAELARAVL